MELYGEQFYDVIREGTRSSVAVVAPLVLDAFGTNRVRSLIDVGCGEGWWASEFHSLGVEEVVGVDGHFGPAPALADYRQADLSTGLVPALGRFDVALCLEVAEHLPPQAGDTLVDELCRLARVVVWSAAIPGQGGSGHVNEQWPSYWTERFEKHGYAASGALRFAVWDDERVENWYRQNLLVMAQEPTELPELFDSPLAPPWPLVHPVLYDARRQQ